MVGRLSSDPLGKVFGKIKRIPHETSLIATIAAGLGLAFILGLLAARLKLPLLLGYLIAGMAIGPFSPGFVADVDLATQLSEIGVSLLMFGVGLHFSIKDLLSVRKIALPGAIVQILAATAMGAIAAQFFGWSWGAGIVFGLCLSVASTVVLLRALGEAGIIDTTNGKIAIGWLVVEDLVTVVALVVLPALSVAPGGGSHGGDTTGVATTMLLTVAKVGTFVAAMLVIGKTVIPRLLGRVARTGSRELFTLGVLAVALGVAFGAAGLFGVSPALGAFFAGVVISESDLSYQANAETLSLQEAFTVLFFVSVGMKFDPQVLAQYPLHVLVALAIVMVGKSLAALFITLLFRYPILTGLTIAASLAQIGEFSFILINLGIYLNLVPKVALSIVLAAAILSIALNPLIFQTINPINQWLANHPSILKWFERSDSSDDQIEADDPVPISDHVVMIGYGRVGKTIGSALSANGIPFVVVDLDRVTIDQLKGEGVPYVFGDASRKGILAHAGLQDAKLVIVATPAKSSVREIVKSARAINPAIAICVRSHEIEDAENLADLGVQRIVLGEFELALEMSKVALDRYGVDQEARRSTIGALRSSGLVNKAVTRK